MIVMGGIIGSGIFMNPSVVALQVHTPFLDSRRVGTRRVVCTCGGVYLGRARSTADPMLAASMRTCEKRFIRVSHLFMAGFCCL